MNTMDTLKGLVMRNIESLEYVIDRLAGGLENVPEELLDYIDAVRLQQYEALAAHMPVGVDERLGELRQLPPEAYVYDDGSPVREEFTGRYGSTVYFPRYDGDRGEALARHKEWVAQLEQRIHAETTLEEITRDFDDGPHSPNSDE
ncbi:MAG: hypothetical protein ACTHZ9_03340 [Leucobacter sp.]